jgi:hypothetical protein
MQAEEAINHTILQLLTYIASDIPNEGLFENTADTAMHHVTALKNNETYIFDYNNLREQVGVLVPHHELVSYQKDIDRSAKPINLMCIIDLKDADSPIDGLIYFSIRTFDRQDKDTWVSYRHLTVPQMGESEAALETIVDVYRNGGKVRSHLTPQSMGLATFIKLKPTAEEMYVDLAAVNEALGVAYQSAPLDNDGYAGLYHKTVFGMSYAIDKMLCERHRHETDFSWLFTEDVVKKSHSIPTVVYHTVKILEQPARTDAH